MISGRVETSRRRHERGIRDARIDDINELGRVHVRAWQAAYRAVMPDEYLDGLQANDRADVAPFLEAPHSDQRLHDVTVDDVSSGSLASGLG
jgi:hypothetical protein